MPIQFNREHVKQLEEAGAAVRFPTRNGKNIVEVIDKATGVVIVDAENEDAIAGMAEAMGKLSNAPKTLTPGEMMKRMKELEIENAALREGKKPEAVVVAPPAGSSPAPAESLSRRGTPRGGTRSNAAVVATLPTL